MHDISRIISPRSVVYPGDASLANSPICSIGPGCPCNITSLGNWSTHFLTHVDPPLHFVDGGASLDEVSLSRFMGRAKVIQVSGHAVTERDVQRAGSAEGQTLLFKSRNSAIPTEAPFAEDHVYMSEAAVREVARIKANMVGIDYLSVDRFGDDNYPAHKGLLSRNILILEGLDLSGVPEGEYELLALPLKISAGDGSPVRAVLRDARW